MYTILPAIDTLKATIVKGMSGVAPLPRSLSLPMNIKSTEFGQGAKKVLGNEWCETDRLEKMPHRSLR